MVYTYQKAVKKYDSQFKTQKAIKNGELTKLERGLYTDSKDIDNFDYIVNKYPKVIFTMDSAFFYHGLYDKKPNNYHLATTRTALRIKDNNITQYFQINKLVNVGVISMKIDDHIIKVYDKERMLIELIRNRKKISNVFYNQVIHNYYMNKEDLNEKKLMKYIIKFKMKKFLINKINEELEMDLYI